MNQPLGYLITSALRPTYHYARRHDYIYYPESWTDAGTGTVYEKGYYDENGVRYENVAFGKGGKYENVLFHCPYCGQDTVLNLDNDQLQKQDLACPHCGGTMEIQSALDEITGESADGTLYGEDPVVNTKKENKTLKRVIIGFAILLSVFSVRSCMADQNTVSYEPPATVQSGTQTLTGTDSYGSVIYLVKHQDGSYGIINDPIREYDKTLTYDRETDNYYDSESDCWLWRNTEVSPPVWQYWYEGISSDYGDYGWMEHAADGWHIEKSDQNWIKLPAKYDTGRLWYIS